MLCGGWPLEHIWDDLADAGFRYVTGYAEHRLNIYGDPRSRMTPGRYGTDDFHLNPWRPTESGWTSGWYRHNPEGRVIYVPNGRVQMYARTDVTKGIRETMEYVDPNKINSCVFPGHEEHFLDDTYPQQFEELEASSLFCGKCKQAVPVRKKLLLVLPEGEKFDYLCAQCGNSVGSKTSKEDSSMQFGIK